MNKSLMELENQAFKAYMERDFVAAISLYKEILEIQNDFEHGSIYEQLAICYEETGQIELAKEAYLQSLAQDPDDYIKLCAYGSFLLQKNDYMEAYEIYNKIYNHELTNNMDVGATLIALKELVKKNNISGSDMY